MGICGMSKYVSGFKRLYSDNPNAPYMTVGLVLFCRYHRYFEVNLYLAWI